MDANGFNEAPIHESGKFGETAHRELDSGRGFNEAPIHESGKSARADLHYRQRVKLQ